MENIGIGIEIECILNRRIHSVEKGSYHNGLSIEGLSRWEAESDGSLSDDDEFDEWGDCIEIISPILRSKEEFKRELGNFRDKFSKRGSFELNEVLSFNSSCGSHIHFSVGKFSFDKKVIFEIYPKVRKYFKDKILSSNIESKEDIVSHYDRDYSIQLDKENNYKDDRHSEFNFGSENCGKGIEWRSPNLLNIQSWKEFFEFWEIVYSSLEYFYEISHKYEESQDMRLNEGEIREIGRAVERHNEDFIFNRQEIKIKNDRVYYEQRKRKQTHSNFNIQTEFVDLESEEIELEIQNV